MNDLDDIQARLKGHALVRAIDRVPRGHVRLETAFLYPDGGSVDVFVVEEDPLFRRLKLSDLGQTISWLADVQVRPWLSKKRQRFIEDALRIYDVRQAGGALETDLPSLEDLVSGIVRLGQACVRVADLIYTRRTALQVGITEEIEEVLAETDFDYETNVELEGRFGAKVRVDFLVPARKMASAILALSSANSSQAHVVANEIFRKWYDLAVPERPEQRITIFDDRYDVYRTDDLERLRNVSDLVALSERQTIIDLLAA